MWFFKKKATDTKAACKQEGSTEKQNVDVVDNREKELEAQISAERQRLDELGRCLVALKKRYQNNPGDRAFITEAVCMKTQIDTVKKRINMYESELATLIARKDESIGRQG